MAYYSGIFGSSGMYRHYRGVPNSGSWIRGVSPIQGAGLEGFHCISSIGTCIAWVSKHVQ